MREDLKVAPAPILRFNTTFTRQIASEVLHHPTIDQRIAVEALTYTMEAIDELLAETLALSQKFMRPMGQADRQSTTEHLLSNFADSVSNLRRLIEQCQSYIDGDFRRIIAKQYDPRDYEEA